MDADTIMRKNLDLHAEWMRYVFEHPEILDQVPEGAQLIILPTDDPELAAENLKIVHATQQRGAPAVVIRMTSPKLSVPHLEVVS